MKQNLVMITLVAAAMGLSFCGSQADKAVDMEITRLNSYFDSVKSATPAYTAENWDKIKSEYNTTVDKMQTQGDKLSDEVKQKFETTKADYNKMKADYEEHIQAAKEKAAANNYKTALRNALFGDEKIGSDMQFNFVTAKNALPVYDRFVTTVKDNQNKYSREDWDEIKVLYEALDTRKNEIEKDLASADNLKIAGLKVKFATIKSVKRPLSKIDENDAAKSN